jgi:type III restriction enzyme
MNLREFNAFLINNKEKLIELFSEISAREIADIEQTEILHMEWDAPKEQYYKMHKRLAGRRVMGTNMFADYRDNILIEPNRSYTERLFETYCEQSHGQVEWLYKNGDKGLQFFSVVYHMAFKRANFYPDYIIKTKTGEIWIIEAKGGVSADGESKNIDNYAKNKFEALKEYASRHPNIKWGFVRAVGSSLYISNTQWTDDMFNQNIWKPIEDLI